MNESKRQQKFAKLIQKDLSEIFQRDTRGILDNAFITVAHVTMSPDLSIAKVYLSMMMVKDKDGLIEKITSRKSELRKLLGMKIGKQVRIVPDLIFYVDELEENAMKLDKLIDSLDIPKKEESDDEE
ncbi:MAG: 30S ribosome-binding factor RbfA [Bacteroidota bacterium]